MTFDKLKRVNLLENGKMKKIFSEIVLILKQSFTQCMQYGFYVCHFLSPLFRFLISINIKIFCMTYTFRRKTRDLYSPVSFIQFFWEHFYHLLQHSTQNNNILFNNPIKCSFQKDALKSEVGRLKMVVQPLNGSVKFPSLRVRSSRIRNPFSWNCVCVSWITVNEGSTKTVLGLSETLNFVSINQNSIKFIQKIIDWLNLKHI